jgi:hypothetical protein
MCTGWKNPNLLAEAKIKEAMANNQPVPQLERKTSCRDCGHEITDHGNLLSLVMPELKRRVILALKINNMMQVRDRDLSREIGLLTECVVPSASYNPTQLADTFSILLLFRFSPCVCRVASCVCVSCVRPNTRQATQPSATAPAAPGAASAQPKRDGHADGPAGRNAARYIPSLPTYRSSLPRFKLAPPTDR